MGIELLSAWPPRHWRAKRSSKNARRKKSSGAQLDTEGSPSWRYTRPPGAHAPAYSPNYKPYTRSIWTDPSSWSRYPHSPALALSLQGESSQVECDEVPQLAEYVGKSMPNFLFYKKTSLLDS